MSPPDPLSTRVLTEFFIRTAFPSGGSSADGERKPDLVHPAGSQYLVVRFRRWDGRQCGKCVRSSRYEPSSRSRTIRSPLSSSFWMIANALYKLCSFHLHIAGLLRCAMLRLSSPRPKGPPYSRGTDRLSQTAAVQNRDETENDQHADPYPAANVASREEIEDYHRQSSSHERCDNDAEYLTAGS